MSNFTFNRVLMSIRTRPKGLINGCQVTPLFNMQRCKFKFLENFLRGIFNEDVVVDC